MIQWWEWECLNGKDMLINFVIVVDGFLTVNLKFENLCVSCYALIVYKTQCKLVGHNSA